jgi:hypothetical protein
MCAFDIYSFFTSNRIRVMSVSSSNSREGDGDSHLVLRPLTRQMYRMEVVIRDLKNHMLIADMLLRNADLQVLPRDISENLNRCMAEGRAHLDLCMGLIRDHSPVPNSPIVRTIINDRQFKYFHILFILYERRRREWSRRPLENDSYIEPFTPEEVSHLDNFMTLFYVPADPPEVMPRDFFAMMNSPRTPNTRMDMYTRLAHPTLEEATRLGMLTPEQANAPNARNILDYCYPQRLRPGLRIPWGISQFREYPLSEGVYVVPMDAFPNVLPIQNHAVSSPRIYHYTPLPRQNSDTVEFECPLCTDTHLCSETPYWRCRRCNNPVCMDAVNRWNSTRRSQRQVFSCPLCRDNPVGQ